MLIPNINKNIMGTHPFKATICTLNQFKQMFADFLMNTALKIDGYEDYLTETDYENKYLPEDLHNINADELTAAQIGWFMQCLINYIQDEDIESVKHLNYRLLDDCEIELGNMDDVACEFGYNDDDICHFHEVHLPTGDFTCLSILSGIGDDSATMTAIVMYFDPRKTIRFYIPFYGNTVIPNTKMMLAAEAFFTTEDYPSKLQTRIKKPLPAQYGSHTTASLNQEEQFQLSEFLAYKALYGIDDSSDPNANWLNNANMYGWISECKVDFDRITDDIASNVQL